MAQSFQFANPADYSDWATYSGFNRKTGEQDSYVPAGGVAPTNISEFMNQAIAPAQQKMDVLSGVASNISQGNMGGAYQAFKQKPLPTFKPLGTPVTNNAFGYHIDDLEQ
jgi:hypothetical protein